VGVGHEFKLEKVENVGVKSIEGNGESNKACESVHWDLLDASFLYKKRRISCKKLVIVYDL
jgi:hypothetical protein